MNSTFADFGINSDLIDRLSKKNIFTPTAIQAKVMSVILSKENTIFSSATGTGKTFAYLLPIITNLYSQDDDKAGTNVKVLILSPSSELCSQIKKETDFLLENNVHGLSAALLIGQAKVSAQIEILRKQRPQIIIANVSRVYDLAVQRKIRLNTIEYLVLDEADRLVAKECIEMTRALIKKLPYPEKRTTIALSATMSPANKELLKKFFSHEINELSSANNDILQKYISHWALWSERRKKMSTLRSFITAAKPKKTLVFLNRAEDAAKLAADLQFHKIAALALWSGMETSARRSALNDFIGGRVNVLVTTDLASRGLDIPRVTHVINYDINEDAEVYIHRAGRSGRNGNTGIMVSIGDERELEILQKLEKKLKIAVYPKVCFEGKLFAPEELEYDETVSK